MKKLVSLLLISSLSFSHLAYADETSQNLSNSSMDWNQIEQTPEWSSDKPMPPQWPMMWSPDKFMQQGSGTQMQNNMKDQIKLEREKMQGSKQQLPNGMQNASWANLWEWMMKNLGKMMPPPWGSWAEMMKWQIEKMMNWTWFEWMMNGSWVGAMMKGFWPGMMWPEFMKEMKEKMQERKVEIEKFKQEIFKNFTGNEVLQNDEWFNDLAEYAQNVDSDDMKVLLEKKAWLINDLKNLDEKINNVKKKIKNDKFEELKSKMEWYNFYWTDADNVSSEFESLVNSLGSWTLASDQVNEKLAWFEQELKAKIENSKKEKFNKWLIPFKDTDDTDWFTSYVVNAKSQWIVGWYKDANWQDTWEFWPWNNVTIAEMIKMWVEASDLQTDENATPDLSQAKNHWSKKYIDSAENAWIDLLKEKNLNIDKNATRWEVIKALMEMFKVDTTWASTSWFSDVKSNDDLSKYIYKAKDLWIVSWYWWTDTFWPSNTINRAEVSKMLSKFMELKQE